MPSPQVSRDPKVLSKDAEGGRIVLDTVRLPDMLRNAKGGREGFANGVLTSEHLVVSTVSCSSHHECAEAAGIDLHDIDWLDPVPGQGHIRLQLDESTVEAEFWYGEEVFESGDCPLAEERLAAVADWISSHPAIVRAYVKAAPVVEVTLLHDGMRLWKFRDGTIQETPETPVKALSLAP